MISRIDTLLNELKVNNLDSIFITSTANVFYLSNYYTDPHERIIGVFASLSEDPVLLLPSMEMEDAKESGWKYPIIGYHDHENPWELLKKHLIKNENFPQSMGIEKNHLTLERYKQLKNILPETDFKDAQDILANLRVIKNKKEYTLLQHAAQLADLGVETGIKALHEGVSELEVIAQIEYELKKQGVKEMSFSTMALFGKKTGSPHGTPGLNKLEKGQIVLFDLGVVFEGYCSDITRTVAYHSLSEKEETIYHTVLEANQKAIKSSEVGVSVKQVDLAAREYINQAGFGDYFNHRVGHGIGIEAHEYPSLHSENELPLKNGMCFTIEPGIYVPNTGGVRIEDMVFMTGKGPEILTKTPKELQIIK